MSITLNPIHFVLKIYQFHRHEVSRSIGLCSLKKSKNIELLMPVINRAPRVTLILYIDRWGVTQFPYSVPKINGPMEEPFSLVPIIT
jgi:hypothetical protein